MYYIPSSRTNPEINYKIKALLFDGVLFSVEVYLAQHGFEPMFPTFSGRQISLTFPEYFFIFPVR